MRDLQLSKILTEIVGETLIEDFKMDKNFKNLEKNFEEDKNLAHLLQLHKIRQKRFLKCQAKRATYRQITKAKKLLNFCQTEETLWQKMAYPTIPSY